jgi:3-oxoadipate enol-lactonase
MHGNRGIGRDLVVAVPAGPGDQPAARRRIGGFEYAAEVGVGDAGRAQHRDPLVRGNVCARVFQFPAHLTARGRQMGMTGQRVVADQSAAPHVRRPPRVTIGRMAPVDLAHDDAGDGPVVVLIHGHPFNRGMWAPQLVALRDRFRVIAPDLRGYGDSPVTPGTMTMAQLAADVSRLLDGKGIARAALAGLSMGGLVVMELAAAQPERWWAYGFIATTAQRLTGDERAARLASARTMEEQGMRPVAEQMAARLFGPEPSPELTARIMAMMLATSPAGAAAAIRGRAERPDYQPVLKSLSAPALVCAGDRDSYSTAEITAELARCLPGAEVVVLVGVGHLPNLERPDVFNEHLLRFLTEALP